MTKTDKYEIAVRFSQLILLENGTLTIQKREIKKILIIDYGNTCKNMTAYVHLSIVRCAH